MWNAHFYNSTNRNFAILSSRTISNCVRKPANNGGGGKNTIQTEGDQNNSPKEVKPKLREFRETPKPESKFCKEKHKETEEIQSKILNMIDKDKADEIDLAFAALNKWVKRTLNEEELEDLMDEINQIATHHIKASGSKKQGIFNNSSKFQNNAPVCTPPPPAATATPMNSGNMWPMPQLTQYSFYDQNQGDGLTFTEL